SPLQFDWVIGSGARGNRGIIEAANRAADYWRTRVFDPISVVIKLDAVNLGDDGQIEPSASGGSLGPLGVAVPVQLELPYAEVRTALKTDSQLEPDDSIVASLPADNGLTVALADRMSTVDTIVLTKANLKAIGLHDDAMDFQTQFADGEILVNVGDFAFDSISLDGVDSGQFDLETLLVHEIGHVLGFISATDTIGAAPSPDNPAITSLDLYRFRAGAGNHQPDSPIEFATARRELRRENEAVIDFILQDGWTTLANEYSVETGDGRFGGQQSSHWLDVDLNGTLIGVLGPTQAPGEITPLSNVDLRAFDLIGYDILPPESLSSVPIATDDAITVIEDTTVLIDVIANDLLEGEATIRITDAPASGTATSEGGQIRYTPGAEFSGVVTVGYQLSDASGLSSLPAEVVITVQPINDAPVSRDDFSVTAIDTSAVIDVLANDSDVDDTLDASGIEIITQPARGSVSQNADGLLVYVPDAGFTGVDSFLYRVSDGQRSGAEALVTITVDSTLTPADLDVRQHDVNADGRVTAIDALMVINELSRMDVAEGEQVALLSRIRHDVNRDGRVTALDALSIINHMNRASSALPAAGDFISVEDDDDDDDEILLELGDYPAANEKLGD
ncbi:MAG: NF038122 family metalloprotease, partial [Planctomycetota bacterium]